MKGENMSNEGLKGRVHAIPQIDETLTKEGYGADAKVVGDKLKTLKPMYMHPTSEEHGTTGRCSFDITPYMEERLIGVITVCGSENKTRMVVVAIGTNFTCEPLMMVLASSPELNVALVGNVIDVEATSGGLWGADLTMYRAQAII
jgi:hypothetical protein